MLGDIKSAVKDNNLAQEYLGNLERLLKLAPHVREYVSNSKYHINEGFLLLTFLEQLDWLAEGIDT